MAKPTLSQLKKVWYEKLKKDGFNDIELDEYRFKDRQDSSQLLRLDHNLNKASLTVKPKRTRQTADEFHSRQDYFYYAEHFLNSYTFESNKERIIWEYHVNGITIRDTAKLLSKIKIKIKKSTVSNIIGKLRKIMKDMYLK